MSDDQDKSQKTEDPTAKKLSEAFEKGNVPKSQEVNHWFMLAGAGLVVAMFGTDIARGLWINLLPYLEAPHAIPINQGKMFDNFRELGFSLLGLLLMPLGIVVAAALAGNLIQHKPVLTTEKMKPELRKISPLSGAKRFVSSKPYVDLAKAIVKLVVISGLIGVVVWPDLKALPAFAQMEPIEIAGIVHREAMIIIALVVALMAAVAGADLFYQRYDWFENLKMSRTDVKDEHKQAEGDPQVKSKIRAIRAERARSRIMAAVPSADVVITNPTHYAVALKYDGENMAAPKLVAKGQDHLAFRIRDLAKQHDIPVLENPPLARGLYKSVDLDREIPPEFYKAVAEIISYVYRLKQRSPVRTGAGQ